MMIFFWTLVTIAWGLFGYIVVKAAVRIYRGEGETLAEEMPLNRKKGKEF